MKSDTIKIKISGEQELVELVVKQLEELYPLTVTSNEIANDADSGVHVFMTVNPASARKVVKS